MREQPCQGVLLNRLNFAAELGQRFAADLAQDLGIAPFTVKSTGPKASLENSAFDRELAESILDNCWIQRESFCDIALGERTMGTRVPTYKLKHRLSHGFDESGGEPGWKRNAESIAITGGVLHGDQPALTGYSEF